MKGFFNRLLQINLEQKQYQIQPLQDKLLAKTLGGKGLASHILLAENPPQVDPLCPENRLIFALGPVSGTTVWGECRYGVFTKSPHTGFYSESYAGGKTPDFMAKTGFDAFVLQGASDQPVWIEIADNTVTFHDAADLWGKETYGTEDRIKNWIKENRPQAGGCGVVCIGPAGENLVSCAVIENDKWRSAGRTGVGAVMGSKKVKAIAFRGSAKKEVADAQGLKSFNKEFAGEWIDSPAALAYKSNGTAMMVDIVNSAQAFPTRYWSKGFYEGKSKINRDALHEQLDVTPHACLKCFMACGRMGTVKQGRHQGLVVEGPEFETIGSFGGLCEIDDITEIAYLNDLCDRLGLDTMSAGNLAAMTIEASRQGKIDYRIDYSQPERVAELLTDMAYRRGIGNVLANGIKYAAAQWDFEDQAVHVKGLEPAAFDPRVLKGMALGYGTSPRGACHLRTTFYKPELAGMVDPEMIAGKAKIFAEWEDRLVIFDTLILCRFYRDFYQWEQLEALVSLVTGLKIDKNGLRSLAGGISDEVRKYNIQEGLTAEDDMLPRRFHEQALPESGKVITREDYQIMLGEYYQSRGWSVKGVPN
jgi:aldehyde:ferredoxin oxidoreductase